MKKDVTLRISYYVRKVAERGAINRSEKLPRAYTYRSERLLTYKKLMHEQICK